MRFTHSCVQLCHNMLYSPGSWEVFTISKNDKMPSSLPELLRQLAEQGIQDHRRYQAVRTYLNFRARETGTPISGLFELTPLCNLDCKMCYVHLNRAQMQEKQLLPPEVWESLMAQAIDSGMMYAKLSGGECLTYPDFQRLYLFLRNRGIETGILTNGTLLDQKMADFFRENPPASIQLTLYGASEEAYAQVTGHRSFGLVMENIRRLLAYGLPLSVTVTPNAFMTDGPEIIRLVHSLGLTPQINSGLMNPREETGRSNLDADIDTYIQLHKLNRALGGQTLPTPCDEDTLPDPGGISQDIPCGVTCGAGRSGFSIGWDGTMRPCNTFPNIAENALELGFSGAWNRIHQQAIRFPLPIECTKCTYKESCGTCLAEHAAGAPIGHASPIVCAKTRKYMAQGLITLS